MSHPNSVAAPNTLNIVARLPLRTRSAARPTASLVVPSALVPIWLRKLSIGGWPLTGKVLFTVCDAVLSWNDLKRQAARAVIDASTARNAAKMKPNKNGPSSNGKNTFTEASGGRQ